MRIELKPVSIDINTTRNQRGLDYVLDLISSGGTRLSVSGNSAIDEQIRHMIAVLSTGFIDAKLSIDANIEPEAALKIAEKLIKNKNHEAAAWLLKQTVAVLEA